MPAPTHLPVGTESFSGWTQLFVLAMTALALAVKPIFGLARWGRRQLMAPLETRMDRMEKSLTDLHTSINAFANAIQRIETNCASNCAKPTNGTLRPTEVNGFPHHIESHS